jgi:hypothetical protein
VLGQSAHDPNDASSTLDKTYRLVGAALAVYRAGQRALAAGKTFEQLDLATPRRLLAMVRRASSDEVPSRAADARSSAEALAA